MPPTPMIQQYHEAKASVGEALLLFRMGDFYELFFEDAKTAARELGLALTSRDKGENPIPMAGFPHHQLNGYLAKIISAGYRAAICEQVEDPKASKGLVRREVTRIVSPGTVTDDALLKPQESNFLAAVFIDQPHPKKSLGKSEKKQVGLAWIDISTGRFYAAALTRGQLADQLARIEPSELLLVDDPEPAPEDLAGNASVTLRPPWAYGEATAVEVLGKHFGTKSLRGFGFDEDQPQDVLALRAAGAVVDYLNETQKASLAHIDQLIPWTTGQAVEIDPATRRSLEIVQTLRSGSRDGSLLGVIDRTVTAMGARLLADWLAAPLTDIDAIEGRLDAVAEFEANPSLTRDLNQVLKSIYDIERLLARVTTGRASPRDLSFVGRTLSRLPEIKVKLDGCESALLQKLETQIDLCTEVRTRLENSLVDDCPLASREGGIIKDGVHPQLDELRKLCVSGKKWMAEYQAGEIRRTGITNLKVGFNKVFGYYLEVTAAHRDKVPTEYIRKQTLKNAERFITPELKEYEEKVLTANEQVKDLEYELFAELRDLVSEVAGRLRGTAAALAQVDVLVSLAELARSRQFVRPEISARPVLIIEEGRHPVLDITEPQGTFVPNGVQVEGHTLEPEYPQPDGDQQATTRSTLPSLLLITGPNMSGKSTYIRQAALLTLLAQIGSFVPARHAVIGVADRIFARVGANDELSRGQSTFMVEMTETARILNTATQQSLVILDEIGRGTSTYDGLSIAWSIVEHLQGEIGCRCLFATHYHELTELENQLPGVQNRNVAVKEWDDKVVFLHQVVAGAAGKSYGIHVAQLAGVPKEVNERALEVLAWLESQHDCPQLEQGSPTKVEAAHSQNPQSDSPYQLTLFERIEHPLLDEIRHANIDETTPLEALKLLQKWKQGLEKAAR